VPPRRASERDGDAGDEIADRSLALVATRHVTLGVGGAGAGAARERFIPARGEAPSESDGVDRVAARTACA
jgi:hypothetical protein